MADRVAIVLEGGPCDGRQTTARRADFGPVGVTCKGVEYEPTARTTKAGRLVYTTKASQQPPAPPSSSSVAQPMTAHHGWSAMLRDVFVHAPKELIQSGHARQAMHDLTRRRGLR